MEINEVLAQLPPHLMQFVIDQPYNSYTFQDHAVWRYVMRQNYNHLTKVAHEAYVDGLLKTGIEIDKIANMYGMNRILKKIGWAAAAVDGFIPPGAFMEFQAYKILVIAADIRTIDHIEYTPAPDIIHESAGHAPIIADPEYARYLIEFGKVGSKAFSSKKDYELYEAIRHLSIIKEDPHTPEKDIVEAEHQITEIQKDMGEPSEMALCRNLHWWTAEYGLIGTVDNFKIYGAGLLSSIGESVSCLDPAVKKIPYSIEAKDCNYDITKPQPQLFVTPDFKHLTSVLQEFVATMAWKTGGLEGIRKAIASENTATCVYSSGLQVSGTFSKVLTDEKNQPIFIETKKASALAIDDQQLEGHGKAQYSGKYAAPIGKLKNSQKLLEDFTNSDLEEKGITPGRSIKMEFESGITAQGDLEKITRSSKGKIILFEFSTCIIDLKDNQLFKSKGMYGMAIGEKIISTFSGPADIEAFQPIVLVPKEKTHKIEYDDHAIRLHDLYGQVRLCRENRSDYEFLNIIWKTLKEEYPKDWLLPLEILEILNNEKISKQLQEEIRMYLEDKIKTQPHLERLIENGLALI